MNELRSSVWLAVIMFAMAAAPSRAASLPPPGAASCSGCHTTASGANLPVPRLNGRDAGDIVTAMAAFRDGTRPATVMNRIAKGFSDEEVRPIAAWLAAQKQDTR
jgi:cytochrome c553